MTVESVEVTAFLSTQAPYAQLPSEILSVLATELAISYVRRGKRIKNIGDANTTLYLVRQGAVDVLDRDNILVDRRESGRSFGYSSLISGESLKYSFEACEDSLLYLIPEASFRRIANHDEAFARYFASHTRRIHATATTLRQGAATDLLRRSISDFMVANPTTASPTTSIQDAAIRMHKTNVSSLIILEDSQLVGIVTDRDFRKKVVANALDVSQPLSTIMSTNVVTIATTAQAFEAMLMMTEFSIHHLPVLDGTTLAGIVSSPDIMRLLQSDPIYLLADLKNKYTTEQLQEVHTSASEVALRFIERGSSPGEISSVMNVSADALGRHIISMAIEHLGPAPVPFSFITLGSQGRREMGFASDQDNALILDNSYEEKLHGDYFQALGDYTSRHLAAAGQPLCPGDMMVSNPTWRMTEDEWITSFHRWITAPEPDSLLYVQTFFDMRSLFGQTELEHMVRRTAYQMAHKARRLHAHLAALAARREPPLGFFRGFVLERDGEYRHTLDIKKGGIAAIVQMARLYAITAGVSEISTRDRLKVSHEHGVVSAQGAQDLIDSFDFLNSLTFKHQGKQIRGGLHPDYHIDPILLGKMDREHLRDAFGIIKSMQTALATTYPVRTI
ncbi:MULTISPECIES: putative nucleotidyltransferase substrate binding domain-containing protein [unclassified Corynebacterium]|uniref:putative nucleotidyltransferase substrate binding domain-containing protein n=1 Tax=unclassified Corynebacterium TaxID=2624378 RepID=UPI00216980B9|nr:MULTISPECIES: putative nucleotidyltransferase substrate binding domain-containing protein [unclassified Corynebacterium]MCS4491865.1 DUF294 nucleotidyltransferase-like domain-containing protein [Corynebacterium sp. ES2715-CONJ3]MCS4531970.1 DUF294 nucleotidyltransferase-like domain-containing protein [Corynebacterium sp. ES2730-CONJ]